MNEVIADKSPGIMQWFSPVDARRRHQDVRTDRIDGVGKLAFRNKRGSEVEEEE